MTRRTRALIYGALAAALLCTAIGCSDSTGAAQEDASNSPDGGSPPSVTRGVWEPTGGPPLSGGPMIPGDHNTAHFLGQADSSLYLMQEDDLDTTDPIRRIVRVDGESGEWEHAVELEEVRGAEKPFRVREAGDALYFTTYETTYRRDFDGSSWEDTGYAFEDVFELDGVVVGWTGRFDDEHGSALYRRDADGEWVTEIESGEAAYALQTGDLLHVQRPDGVQVYAADGTGLTSEPSELEHLQYARELDGLRVDGDYIIAGGVALTLLRSTDGVEWTQERLPGRSNPIDFWTKHDGKLYGIVRVLDDPQTGMQPVEITDDQVEQIDLPIETEFLAMESVGGHLYVLTADAGLWRLSGDESTWKPMDLALRAPSWVAASDEGVCTLKSQLGVPVCRRGVDEPWEFLDPGDQRAVTGIFSGAEGVFFSVLHAKDAQRVERELWKLDSSGEPENLWSIPTGDGIFAAFEGDDRDYVLLPRDGLFRVDDNHSMSETLPDFSELYTDATMVDGEAWKLKSNRQGKYIPPMRRERGQWIGEDDGLGETDGGHYDGHWVTGFTRTESDLFVYANLYNEDSESPESQIRGMIYRWAPDDGAWEPLAPPNDENSGEPILSLVGSGELLFAATRSEVYRYDIETDEWSTLSDGLEGRLAAGTLTAHDDRVYIGVKGRGLWRYFLED